MRLQYYLSEKQLLVEENIISTVLQIDNIKTKFNDIKEFLNTQGSQNKKMLELIDKYYGGEDLSPTEIKYINTQLKNILKLTGLSVIFTLPFGSFLLPLLVKIGRRLGIDILPEKIGDLS